MSSLSSDSLLVTSGPVPATEPGEERARQTQAGSNGPDNGGGDESPQSEGLSHDLRRLLRHAEKVRESSAKDEAAAAGGSGGAGGAGGAGGVTFGSILDVLGTRAQAVFVLLLAFPFLVPTPPGFSTPAGLAIAFLGVSVIAGKRPWLPGFVARKSLSHAALEKVVGVTLKLFSKVEKLAKPRLGFMLAPGLRWMAGVSLVSAAFILALPIPIPWNNGPPAICILILGLGLLERDGLLILIGHIYNALMWVALFFVGDFLLDLMHKVLAKLG